MYGVDMKTEVGTSHIFQHNFYIFDPWSAAPHSFMSVHKELKMEVVFYMARSDIILLPVVNHIQTIGLSLTSCMRLKEAIFRHGQLLIYTISVGLCSPLFSSISVASLEISSNL